MAHGGARPGAGRPKGRKNTHVTIDGPVTHGIKPLDFLLAVVANPDLPFTARFAAAKEAAPYVHRKLAPLPAPKDDEKENQQTPDEAGWEHDLGLASLN